MKNKKLLFVAIILFATIPAFGQKGLFYESGVRLQNDADNRFSISKDWQGGFGIYTGIGKEFDLLSWLSCSPIATVSHIWSKSTGYRGGSAPTKSVVDIRVELPVNLKIPLKNEGRYFSVGIGPFVNYALWDKRDDIKLLYAGAVVRLSGDVSDTMFVSADINFGLRNRYKNQDTFTSSVSVGLGWKF